MSLDTSSQDALIARAKFQPIFAACQQGFCKSRIRFHPFLPDRQFYRIARISGILASVYVVFSCIKSAALPYFRRNGGCGHMDR
jgi:hypothetical protein